MNRLFKKGSGVLLGTLLLTGCIKNRSTEVAQPGKHNNLKPASSFISVPKAKLLLVGTFHFNYPGLDGFKAPDKDKVDVLSERRQQEVIELVAYIKKFRPTKIAIEATAGWGATEKLRAYKNGQYRDRRDERFQLAMRMAKDLGMDTLYAIDAPTIDDVLKKEYPAFRDSLWRDFDWRGISKVDSLYRKWQEYSSKLNKEESLLDSFIYSNSEESLSYAYAANFSGDFVLDDYRGADVMSIYWFNRNLRTVRNIQSITGGSEDRILVFMGRGHIALLKQFFYGAPDYDVLDFDSL